MVDDLYIEDEFDEARDVYETLLARASGAEDATAAKDRALLKAERICEGFAEKLRAHEDAVRTKIARVRLMPMLIADGAVTSWYGGPREHVGEWPRYRTGLAEKLPEKAVGSVDESTTEILGHCANPDAPGDRRKGLVIGYVQSGKTANYAGLIAKAVDAGYRIVIVLAGMHTNLRVQTQTRLERDLGMSDIVGGRTIAWHELTGPETDIGSGNRAGFLSSRSSVAVMVVKKHKQRLENVSAFLRRINEDAPDFLLERPVLIIDDESDQATPNTQGAKDEVSAINQCVRDIWREVRTGTYVAYTATPFANIFINPDDPDDVYPDDFVVSLPKPDGYMGADRFFCTTQNAGEDDDTIYSLAREVPDEEARVLAPSGRNLENFEPTMTDSLERAIRWFLIATAVRRLRAGRSQHSSMLIHTSHRTGAHKLLETVVVGRVGELSNRIGSMETEFQVLFDEEYESAAKLRDDVRAPWWPELWSSIMQVAGEVSVKVDNGVSSDRLVYRDDEAETVIAIGGGTLSRGLTLEGLVVSYFLRTSNTYDTLLQMGRWFGFRPSYADLVRLWVGPGLLEDYAHLARVERELRDEVRAMSAEKSTPREMAVKVLAHPGRLEITARSKMSAAVIAKAGLGGTRRQTIYLDRSENGCSTARATVETLLEGLAARGLVPVSGGRARPSARPPLLFRGVTNDELVEFLRGYWVAESDQWLQPAAMQEWLARHGGELSWNLVIASGNGSGSHAVEVAGHSIGTVVRNPLKADHWDSAKLESKAPDGAELVNIRALMAGGDQMLDLRIMADNLLLPEENAEVVRAIDPNNVESVRDARRTLSPEAGLIVLYLIDKDSRPTADAPARRAMEAPDHVVGLGIVYPSVETEDDGEFWSADLKAQLVDDKEDLELIDGEADHVMGEDR